MSADPYRMPELRLRQWCVEQAVKCNPANPAAAFETAAALERFVRTGDYRRHPRNDTPVE